MDFENAASRTATPTKQAKTQSRRSSVWLRLAVALPATIGCATIGPAEERNARTVLQSERFVQERVPARLKLKGESHWDTPDLLLASVDQENTCQDGYREKVSTTTITSHKTKNFGVEALIGLGLGAAGGVALAVAPQLSDVSTDPNKESPRNTAQLWGGLGIAGGGVLLGHVAWAALASMDKESEPVVTHEVRASGEKPRECGSQVAGPGDVLATVGRRSITLAAVDSGKGVAINPRERADELCSDPTVQDEKAIIKYVLRSDAKMSVEIGTYTLRRCVAATTARKKIRTGSTALGSANDARQIAQVLRLLAEAQDLTASLPKNDPDKSALEEQLTKVKAAAGKKGVAVLAPLLKQTLARVEADTASAVQPALDTLEVARIANSQDDVRQVLYEAFTARTKALGFSGYVALSNLLEGDTPTKACLESGTQCSPALPQAKLVTLIEPTIKGGSDAVGTDAAQLTAATKAVAKAQTAKSVKAFDAALAGTRASVSACKNPLAGLKASCQPLLAADDAASSFASINSSQLTRVRDETAASERAASLKRTTQRWRTHFAACRRLQDGVRAVDALSSCDSGCQQAISRMRAEAVRLRNFTYSESVDDPVVLRGLTDECNAAGCETCP